MALIPGPYGLLAQVDRLDIIQGNPPVSPPGIARIAMIAGVPSVSINGGAYASLGSAGAAPASGVRLFPVHYDPVGHIDIVQGNPSVSPVGTGRIGCIAGVPSVSIEGAAFSSLGASGSAPAGTKIFPGFLPAVEYIDIIQGNPPVSPPGTARIACLPGASTLSVSIEGAAYVTLGLSPPGSPSLWFDGGNIDGLNNSSLVDGQALALWRNLGSLGNAGDLVQATAGLKPTFRLVASVGKLNNRSGVEAIDTARIMTSGAFASQVQPYVIAAVWKNSTAAGFPTVMGSAPTKWYTSGGGGGGQRIEVSGVSIVSTTTITLGTYYMGVATVNGAGSEERIDGNSNLGTCGATAFGTTCSLFDSGAGQNMQGIIPEALMYFGTLPSLASIEAYFTAKFGAFPQ